MKNKKVRIFDNEQDYYLTDIKGLKFLDSEEEDVDARVNATEIQGMDGVLMSPFSYGPFNLKLRFFYRGTDSKDYRLMKQKLRGMLFKRTPYFINHSDMPGIKYTVYCEENAITDIAHKYGEFEITFVVYKGYSESLYETNQYDKTSDKWQFGNGLLVNDDIKYKHNATSFRIFNGSSDTIAPFPHRHKLVIKVNVNAPNGFKLINRTTGDVFEYKKALKSNQQLIINGVYPTINGKRVGINTNHEWLSLAPGYNDIEITGTDITQSTVEFIFPFIYR